MKRNIQNQHVQAHWQCGYITDSHRVGTCIIFPSMYIWSNLPVSTEYIPVKLSFKGKECGESREGERRQMLVAGDISCHTLPKGPMALYPVLNLWLWGRLEENLYFRGFREAASGDPHKSSWSCNQTRLIRQSDQIETLSAELPWESPGWVIGSLLSSP